MAPPGDWSSAALRQGVPTVHGDGWVDDVGAPAGEAGREHRESRSANVGKDAGQPRGCARGAGPTETRSSQAWPLDCLLRPRLSVPPSEFHAQVSAPEWVVL